MPYLLPRQPTFRDYIPELEKDLLLAAITHGASIPFQGLGKVATAGQYQAPGGQSTFISPAERVASNPNMSAAQMISQQAPPTARFTPTQFGIGHVPNYDQMINQAKVQNLPLERQKLQGEIQSQQALSGVYSQMSYLKQIEDDALSGDEDAVAAYRYLKSRGAF